MTLPNGAAGIDYTTWGISGDGSLPDQATRTKEAIQAALRTSYTSQLNSSSVWATSVGNIIEGILKQVWTALTNNAGSYDATKTAFENLAHWAENIITGGISAVLQTIDTFVSGIPNLSTWLATFKTFIDGLLNISNLSTFLDTFKTVINSLVNVSNLSTFVDTLKKLVTGLLGIANFDNWVAGFKQLVNFFNGLAASIGSTLWTVLSEIVNFFSGLFTGSGSITTWLSKVPGISDVLAVINAITGGAYTAIGDGITELISRAQKFLTEVSLVPSLLGNWKNPLTQTNTTLVDLAAYAAKLLTDESVIPSINLFGFLPFDLMSMIPVGHVGNSSPNLITDTGFAAEAVIQSGNGWSWDGTTNNATSTGGSAKVTGDGGVRQLLSNMIQVAVGQTVDLSAAIKWTKSSTSTPTLLIGLRGYDANGSVTFTNTVSSIVAKSGYTSPSSTSSYTVGGNTTVTLSGGWVTISGTSPAVPAGTTQVRMVLGMTNGPSGTTAWFDDAVAQKTQLLQQNLVGNLVDDLGKKLFGTDFQSLLEKITSTPGATLVNVAQTIASFLTGSSALNGSNVLSGNISPTVIKDLIDTWTKTVFGVSGGNSNLANEVATKYSQFQQGLISAAQFSTYLTSVLAAPGDALQNFVGQMSGQGGRITDLETERDKAKSRLDALELALNSTPNGATARLVALETKASFTSPTPPATGATIISVKDDFERASLGSNWTTSIVNSDGSAIGIVNGDVKFTPPAISGTNAQIALTWNGTGKAASTSFQRISTTFGSASSQPASGSPGFNDLIAKASPTNPLYGIVCRYYATGVIKMFYRLGAWETDFFFPANTFATFTVAKPTAGTLFEFYAGDKATSDQTKCYARIGTAGAGNIGFISSTVLGQLASAGGGTGWGFGMGNGLSILAPQASASLNYWTAQDQV